MTGCQDKKINKIQGIAVSSGIIIGKARLVDRSREKIVYEYIIQDDQVKKEVERFKGALNSTKDQILSLMILKKPEEFYMRGKSMLFLLILGTMMLLRLL